ncbi:MAG TPA: hypothetical protein DCY03_01520 [Planctomycetaceae bacterium]|nr:hypothetical protein [Planctomycetaceae bacterium]
MHNLYQSFEISRFYKRSTLGWPKSLKTACNRSTYGSRRKQYAPESDKKERQWNAKVLTIRNTCVNQASRRLHQRSIRETDDSEQLGFKD